MEYRFGLLFKIASLSLIYFVTAYIGLKLDAVEGFATLVWPPSGIALAAILLFGNVTAVGIAFGAFFANLAIGAPWPAAIGIVIGNTLEPLVGAYWLSYFKFNSRMNHLRDLGLFFVFGVLLNTTFSAVIGAVNLWFFGVIESATVLRTMGAWWVGDAFGVMIMAPLVLTWYHADGSLLTKKVFFELSGLIVFACSSAYFLFCGPFEIITHLRFPWPYLLFPFVVFSAMRFGTIGAATVTFIISAMAITGTTLGSGAFIYGTLTENILALHGYIAVIGGTGLMLATAFSEVRKANEAKSVFLANMSHEIRTPLGSILGFTELLRSEPFSNDSKKYLDIIYSNGQLLMSIICDILDMAKIEAGKIEIVRSTFNLRKFFAEISQVLQPSAELKGLKFSVILDPNLPEKINSDPMRLKQIVINIVGNAIKFTAQGEVSIVAQVREEEDLRFVAIIIQDTGIGIPVDAQPLLFQAFSQGDSSTTRKFGGTGLGLLLSRQLANALGGNVILESSEASRGSIFVIKIKID